MRKLKSFNLLTLDGFFEGPNGEIHWHNVDDEFSELAVENSKNADMFVFGRKTYQLMEKYWPTETALKNDPVIAEIMNTTKKIVFSRTLKKADWNNTTLLKDNAAEEILKLKKQNGKDMVIFGSADLSSTLIQNNLIDEFEIMLNPVILGNGSPLFKNIRNKITLKLLNSKTYKNGNVLLTYSV
ncbi:MAG: dihydrofolate reductase family protein [Ignavibacteria bacterium]|nr:dihydrofolate reductase family protein [Ignavibacteria bacterium]